MYTRAKRIDTRCAGTRVAAACHGRGACRRPPSFRSSEAVDAIERQLSGAAGAVAWIKQGVALAAHARIRDRLLDVGYRQVVLTPSDDDAIVARLESLQRSALRGAHDACDIAAIHTV